MNISIKSIGDKIMILTVKRLGAEVSEDVCLYNRKLGVYRADEQLINEMSNVLFRMCRFNRSSVVDITEYQIRNANLTSEEAQRLTEVLNDYK